MKRLRNNAPVSEPRIRLSADPDVTAALLADLAASQAECERLRQRAEAREEDLLTVKANNRTLTTDNAALREQLGNIKLDSVYARAEAAEAALRQCLLVMAHSARDHDNGAWRDENGCAYAVARKVLG